jgi:hypothetical protein
MGAELSFCSDTSPARWAETPPLALIDNRHPFRPTFAFLPRRFFTHPLHYFSLLTGGLSGDCPCPVCCKGTALIAFGQVPENTLPLLVTKGAIEERCERFIGRMLGCPFFVSH